MNDVDFNGLAQNLLGQARELLSIWLPCGKLLGHEWMCGNLRGDPGDSLRVNVNTGKWADFAGEEKGGDLVSLYAAIEGLNQYEAAKRLSSETGYELRETVPQTNPNPKPAEVEQPPIDHALPDMEHPSLGSPSVYYTYKDFDGSVLFYVARYETHEGKQFLPWSWSTKGEWIMKGWPSPRPLYGLQELAKNPELPVMIVEGEKAAEAAKQITEGKYVVVTWPNGAKAIKNADWKPVYNRKVLLWPDADTPGKQAAAAVAAMLKDHCKEIKIIDTEGQPEGWDLADALNEGWDWEHLLSWAKPRARVCGEKPPAIKIPKEKIKTKPQPEPEIISESSYSLAISLGLPQTKQGNLIINLDCVLRVFDGLPMFKDLIWFDEFHQRIFTTWLTDKVHEWGDLETIRLLWFLQREVGLIKASKDMVYDAVRDFSFRFTRNEPRDWMESLIWDQSPRIEDFFVKCFEAEESDYIKAASKNWWKTIVARILQPGCKVDNMIVLESGQGKFKSSALDLIAGGWYAEAHEAVTSKDFYMLMQGKVILEIAELHAFSRSDVTAIKKVVTCRTDRYRPPYGRTSQDFPRQCIFVGTTNEDTYLQDHTGARRFWPIKCGTIDLDYIRDNREQLFAEAVKCVKAGETWHEMPIEQTLDQQESRRQVDEWEPIIQEFSRRKSELTLTEIAIDCLKIDIAKFDISAQRRLGKIMRVLNWDKQQFNRDGQRGWVWRPKNYYAQTDY